MNSISSLRPHLKPLQGNYSKTYNSSQIWSSGKIAHLQMRKLIGCSMASMDKISRPESGQVKIPCVLTVAGSDSGAGAGIQADMKTCAALGVYCCTAITSVTAQNTLGVQGIHLLPADFVTRQMESVLSDISVDVVKTGMLPTEKIIRGVSATLRSHNFRWQFTFGCETAIVVDPVMVATSGDVLAGPAILDALRTELFPLADLVTPNLLEASRLIGGRPVTKLSDMKEAAAIIKNMGPRYVLVKGGHLEDRDDPVDILYDGQAWHELRGTRIQTRNTHGTGCTLASSIAAQIAKGAEILPAVSAAKAYIEETLKHSTNILIGKGQHGPLDHSHLLIENPVGQFDAKTLFLYAVTDSSMNMRWCRSTPEAVQAAIEGGATIVQLRQKEAETLDFLQDAEACVKVARSYGVPLLINDRVDVALACDADGVHLGQSDMPVKKARLFLGPKKIIGLSCKTPDQAYVAWRDGADYVGCGGVYPTNTKKDNKTIGLQGLYEVCKTSHLPVVAIGGISKSNVHEVMHSRPDKLCGVAVVSALFDQPDVHEATREILASLKLAVK